MAKWYLKESARLIVWLCGIGFAILGILGQIAILPQRSTGLIIVLYLFIIASSILWWFSREAKPTQKRKSK